MPTSYDEKGSTTTATGARPPCLDILTSCYPYYCLQLIRRWHRWVKMIWNLEGDFELWCFDDLQLEWWFQLQVWFNLKNYGCAQLPGGQRCPWQCSMSQLVVSEFFGNKTHPGITGVEIWHLKVLWKLKNGRWLSWQIPRFFYSFVNG